MAQKTVINNFTKRLLDKVLAKLFYFIIPQKGTRNMNNLQIIAVGTVVSVILIESLIMNFKLKKALRAKKSAETVIKHPATQRGLIDYKTGRRVDINPKTRKEVFVD
jgi:hypothetical protein